jgi:hypothetical protein
MSSNSSRPGDNRNVPYVPDPDGWYVGGSQGTVGPQPKAGDLLQSGTINNVAPMSRTASIPNAISKISHPKMSSEEPFLAASSNHTSVSVSRGQPGGRSPTMVHTTSQDGTGSRDGIRSKPGANDSDRASVVSNLAATSLISNMGTPMEPVAPLEASANRWVAGSTALPFALATARHIEDINCITYPEGIKSPNVELNVNTQKGKFRCVLAVINIPFWSEHFYILGTIVTFCYSSGISARRSQIIFHHSTQLGSNLELTAPCLLAEDN